MIVTILSGFVKRNLSGKNLHLACGETVRSLKVPAGDFISATQEFSAGHLHFIGIYGNIIRQYCIAAEYALVAQPVEHLTFNQRARDSSSLERTKENLRLTVKRYELVVGFLLFVGTKWSGKCDKNATNLKFFRSNRLVRWGERPLTIFDVNSQTVQAESGQRR